MRVIKKSVIIQKKKKSKNWINIMKTQTVDFCLATGLHGYKYIVQSHRPTPERIIWGIIVILSLCCSLGFLQMAWEYNSAHSTLTVIATMHYGIWNYPFPAVTFCNNNQISSRKARDFVQNLTIAHDLSREFIFKQMKLLIELLDPGIFEEDITANLTLLQDILDANNYSISDVMSMIKQDCSSLFHSCKWKGSFTPCHEIFFESFARDGICCSFNYLNFEDEQDIKIEPKRLNACGHQTGLTVLIDADPEDYYASLYGSYGVKVILHYSYNYPDRSTEYKLIGLGVQAFLAVAPQEVYSTSGVKDLPFSARQCIFKDEKLPKKLQILSKNFIWKNYSYVNCLNQCRMRIIMNTCGCYPYFNPQNGSRECNLKDISCLKKIKFLYDSSWPSLIINNTDLSNAHVRIPNKPCGCLFDCSLYRYPVDSSEGILDKEQFYEDKIIIKTKEVKNFSVVNVFYVDFVSTQYRRDVYYNWKNLFASFGGLLGLFVGFSLMSAFEIIYFFVIRIIIDTCITQIRNS